MDLRLVTLLSMQLAGEHIKVIGSTLNEVFREELQEEPSSGGEPKIISDVEKTPGPSEELEPLYKPKGRPKTDDPVNEKEEFCVMFQSKMSDHHLLYGAEMDCVDSETEVLTEQDLANAHFIELKTNRMIEDRRQDMNFRRFKLRKIWCQSFLVGIDTVVCGYRDDAGVVHQLEELELREIPKMTKGLWYPVVCMDFCDRFLTHVKNLAGKNLTDCDPASVIKFEWKPKQNITAKLICGQSKFSFLPKWFTDNSLSVY
uniref:Decapping nuclease n=1 Tax=Timema bartmani TaxID=61472 RepID=A0A7R9ET70_9NEOP|nr:unnamed protein product [Timema bartmani]